ncbi:cyclase family protein [Brachybacterium sacelli]|uniref:Kynurenine formamidase n=1 Tax=Brachybacterium sacelli TaxID=173364 RepID=A0ABS4X2L8_9MICO|nr:cyclase family protein [Brachybacterium sacelli]MBP2382707.1 kynurenine formamidase [Brachybacterium sacelli]
MTLADLTHPIFPGMTMHPGLPGPRTADHLGFDDSRGHYAPGTEFRIARVEMITSTGTYLDAPQHRYRDGEDVGNLPLERVVDIPCLVVEAPGPAIGAEDLPAAVDGCAVLVRTGWDRHWGTEEYTAGENPHLTAEAADHLADAGALLVGIDSVNIDGTTVPERPVHTRLLAAGVLIVENLTNLAAVPPSGARFSAVPLPVAGMPSFPVRAFARRP